MHRLILITAGVSFLAIVPAAAGSLGPAMELEHARANARAGGPISERDAELLEQYGCLSGTKNKFCEELSQRDRNRHRVKRRYHRQR